MSDNPVRWFAFGVGPEGKILGITPIRMAAEKAVVANQFKDSTISVVSSSHTITVLGSSKKAVRRTSTNRAKWGIEDLHRHFISLCEKYGFGATGLSAKDSANWKMILDGNSADVVADVLDRTISRWEEVKKAVSSLPKDASPSSGVIRGWFGAIHAWSAGKLSPVTSVRESPRVVGARKGNF